MVSTRSKSKTTSAANVGQQTQPGIAAFARTSKPGAGLSAAATAAKKAAHTESKVVGGNDKSGTASRSSQPKKRKLDDVEDVDKATTEKSRKVDSTDKDFEFKVPKLPRAVSVTPNSSRLRARRSNSSLGFAALFSSQSSATQSSVELTQEIHATQDTAATSPEPDSDSSEDDISKEQSIGDAIQSSTDAVHQDVSNSSKLDDRFEKDQRHSVEKSAGQNLEEEAAILRNRLPDTTHQDDTTVEDNLPQEDGIRPSCYDDLTTLHSSFLTALSFHYAYNNPSAPADLREFLPSIEKIWKRRKVLVEDFRRIMYIANRTCIVGDESDERKEENTKLNVEGNHQDEGFDLRIVTYGPGKICLELRNTEVNRFMPPIKNEELLKAKFGERIERLWQRWRRTEEKQSKAHASSAKEKEHDFLSFIPLETIYNSRASFTTPRVGRQRLLEFTEGSLKLRSLKAQGSTIHESAARARRSSRKSTSISSPSGTANRKSSLLQRIRDKETQSSKQPPSPTPEESIRTSASQHVDEVRGILGCMRPTQAKLTPQRRAYRWDEAVGNVIQSLKTPVSKNEVGVCLEMIAEDIKCDWVKIVEIKEVRSLVLTSGGLKGWIAFPEKKAGVEGNEALEKKN
ncbi:hypothetical protein KEM56_001827 [Ascosphaera pollenicola]|nr:hypothetical protein KEM56_001827 [Ascosphaera pollenicola]